MFEIERAFLQCLWVPFSARDCEEVAATHVHCLEDMPGLGHRSPEDLSNRCVRSLFFECGKTIEIDITLSST
jgi:hypothetical protein